MHRNSDNALDGIKIVDFSQNLPGPYATYQLVALGAEVIKVEPPGGEPARKVPWLFASVNGGKKGVAADFKKPDELEKIKHLCLEADVVIEGFRPGVLERFGLDAASLTKVNPKLIYCSISGYGQHGLMAEYPGHDINYQAASGVCHLQAKVGGKPRGTMVPIGDFSAGMNAVCSILTAIEERKKTGRGKILDIALTDSLVSWMNISDLLEVPFALGLFKTSDGQYLALGEIKDAVSYSEMVRAIAPQVELKSAASITSGDIDKLRSEFSDAIAGHSLAWWLDQLAGAGFPYSAVNAPGEAGDAEKMEGQARHCMPVLGPSEAERRDLPTLEKSGSGDDVSFSSKMLDVKAKSGLLTELEGSLEGLRVVCLGEDQLSKFIAGMFAADEAEVVSIRNGKDLTGEFGSFDVVIDPDGQVSVSECGSAIYCTLPAKLSCDLSVQAKSGFISMEASFDGVPRAAAFPVANFSAAQATFARILAALLARRSEGLGQTIVIDRSAALQSWCQTWHEGLNADQIGTRGLFGKWIQSRAFVRRIRDYSIYGLPHYGIFTTKDGLYISLGIVDEDKFWAAFCRSADLGWIGRLPFPLRILFARSLSERVRHVFLEKTLEEWIALLDPTEVPFIPVTSLGEVRHHPQFQQHSQIRVSNKTLDAVN